MAYSRARTPLHEAAWNGDAKEARRLLEKGLFHVNCKDAYGDESPLHCACRRGHLPVVRVLVAEFNAHLNIRDDDGWTPLYRACDGGHLDVIRAMVAEFKADLAIRDKSGWTPLHHVCNERRIDVIRVLVTELKVDLYIQNKHGWTPLHHSCAKGHVDVIRLLASELMVDLATRGGVRGWTPLHCACAGGHLDAIKCLVSEFNADLSLQDNSGRTPLHCACDGGHLDVVRNLVVGFKANPNARDNLGLTPVMLAARNGHESVVMALLQEFQYLVNDRDGNGKGVLHYACATDSVNLVQSLVLDYGADPNALDKDENTPLKIAAYEGKLEVAHLLIKDIGCDPKIGTVGKMLLLQAIKMNDNSLFATLLLVHRPYANARIGPKGTPLQTAAAEGKLDLAYVLITEYGCNPSIGNVGQTLLHKACNKGNARLLQTLLQYVSPLLTDYNGDTALHLVSRADKLNCVKCLVLANAPLLIRNKEGKSPLDVASGRTKEYLAEYLDKNKSKVRKCYNKVLALAKKYAGSHHITRIFVLGYPGAGKSTLIESLKREGFFESFSKVSESSVPPHTAGIIPSVHTSRQLGRILFYDFAGDAGYYSSHAAIFESLSSLRKGKNLFVVVADLREDKATVETTLHYWFSFFQYQRLSNISLIVVGSHLDVTFKDVTGIKEKTQVIGNFCEAVGSNGCKAQFFTLNCRDPRSNQIAQFKRQVFSWISESSRNETTKEASLLLGLLERDFGIVTACPVQTLATHIKNSGVCLPTDARALHNILLELHEVGVLLLLGDHTKGYHHVILNISKLTNQVHELLFSESAISNLYPGFQSTLLNIGVLPENILDEILPEYISKECLIHLQYCQQISDTDVPAFPSLQQCGPTNIQPFLFFPALCNVDKGQLPQEHSSRDSFGIGWLALCTDPRDYFPSRFLHVLLLRLVHAFTLAVPEEFQTSHASPENSRRCTMWRRGVHWLTEKGVDCIVEVVHENRGVMVFSKSSHEWKEECTDVFTHVVGCVMEAKAEFCHPINPCFFLLDSLIGADCLSEDHQFAMSDVMNALESTQGKNVILSVSGRGKLELSRVQCLRKLSHWHNLFPIDFGKILHWLQEIVREVYELGNGLGVPRAILEELEVNFPTDVRKRRREVVCWWLSSSSDPPCWWKLVQALRGIDQNVLAEKIKKKYSVHIHLQGKMLDQKTKAVKPDEGFLRLLADIIDSTWPSLAASLSLSNVEIAGLKGKVDLSQKELAFQMLTIWAAKKEKVATYGELYCKLNSVSLFQHPT